jgi:type I restriction enzyme S subunit
MTDVVDLRPDQLATVQTILAAHVPNAEVWAFGSRAKWTAKDTSDLDLAVVAEKPILPTSLDRLRRAFEDSYLPIKVDVVDFARVSEEFRNVIRKQKVVVRKPAGGDGATRLEWRTLPLEECVETIIDYRGKTPRKVSSGIPLITAKVVKGGRIETPDEFIAPEDYEGWMRRGIPRAGDVLLTMEAPLGEVAQLDDRKVALAQRLVALRGKSGLLDNSFLKYLLQSDLIQDQLRSRASGTTVLGIKQSELRKINLLLPPLPEQQAIAQMLGALDEKTELNQRMNETLEALAQSLFQNIMNEQRQSTNGWRRSTIGKEVRVVGGSTPSTTNPEFWEGGVFHWATPKDLAKLTSPVLLDTERLITQAGVSQISSGLLPAGTVLLSSRAPIGYLAISEVPIAVNQGFIAMVCDKELPNHFVRLWAKQNMDVIEANANGTTFLEISKSNFRPLTVLVPPPQVLESFTRQVEPLHQRMVSNLKESRTLAVLRDALLPKLLSGQLRLSTDGDHSS